VTSSPAGINCGSDCSEAYNYNTSVTLTPTASSGYTFSGWSGDADCSDGTVTMNANKSCTANFSAVQYTLSVSKNGTGSGTVTSSPSGISCGSTCSASYNANTTVTLTASPNSSSTFSGWSGACSGMTCTVTMSAAKSVTATFTLIPPPAAPSNLSVQFYNKSGGYIIYRATWTDNSNNETDFEIIWTGLPISLFDSYLPANTTSTYSPSNGYVCGTYNAQTFMVRAVNNGGESSWVSKSFDWSAYCP